MSKGVLEPWDNKQTKQSQRMSRKKEQILEQKSNRKLNKSNGKAQVPKAGCYWIFFFFPTTKGVSKCTSKHKLRGVLLLVSNIPVPFPFPSDQASYYTHPAE